MGTKEVIISDMTLTEYFSKELQRESDAHTSPLSDETIYYLTHLLLDFSESSHLFENDNHSLRLPTLALMYESAHNAQTPHQRNITLRKLGDSALFLGALFFEHFSRKGINKDYFIGMGGGAYHALAGYQYGNSALFSELAENFPRLLKTIGNIFQLDINYNEEDIFSLLERWQQSNDATLRHQLQSIGITPFEFKTRH